MPTEKRSDRGKLTGTLAHRYTSGHDYFYALSDILENAKETIWILDWWLTPELYLRRPPTEHEDYRLDRLLLRKAKEGVKVYIIVYKEVCAPLVTLPHLTTRCHNRYDTS